MWQRKRPGSPAGSAADDDGGFEQCAPSGAHLRSAPGEGAHLRSAPGEGAHLRSCADDVSGSADAEEGRAKASRGRTFARNGKWNSQDPPEPLTASQLRLKGIALLARREHSRLELQRKMARYSEDTALIGEVLDQLQQEKLLSDARFAEGVARVRGARYGSARVAQDLRARGVSGELAAGLVQDLKASDAERAQTAWQKRFGEAAPDAAGRAKQMRFLQSRGFSPDVIRRVVPRAKAALPEDADE